MVTITHHDGKRLDVTHGTIPDLWHLGMWLKDSSTHRLIIMDGDERARWGQLVLDCWHLAHQLVDELASRPS